MDKKRSLSTPAYISLLLALLHTGCDQFETCSSSGMDPLGHLCGTIKMDVPVPNRLNGETQSDLLIQNLVIEGARNVQSDPNKALRISITFTGGPTVERQPDLKNISEIADAVPVTVNWNFQDSAEVVDYFSLHARRGPTVLKATIGKTTTAVLPENGSAPLSLYWPPRFEPEMNPFSTYADPDRAVAAEFLPPPQRNQLGLAPVTPSPTMFVTVWQNPVQKNEYLKYKYDSNLRTFSVDTSFPSVIGPGFFPGIYALMSNQYFVILRRDQVRGSFALDTVEISARRLINQLYFDTNANLDTFSSPILLSADSSGKRMLVVDNTSPTEQRMAVLSYNDVTHKTPAITVLTLGTQQPLRQLVAHSFKLQDPSGTGSATEIAAVALDKSGTVQVYSPDSETTIKLNDTLTKNIATALNNLGNMKISGLAVHDMDCDDYPDIVLALQNESSQTTAIAWLRYRNDGLFESVSEADRTMVQLPKLTDGAGEYLTGVTTLSVGLLNNDGAPDILLSSPARVQAYINRTVCVIPTR